MRSALSAIGNTEDLEQHNSPSIRQSVYEKMRKFISKVPKSQKEAFIQINNSAIQTCRWKNVAFVDNNIMFLTCNKNLKFLREHVGIIYFCRSSFLPALYSACVSWVQLFSINLLFLTWQETKYVLKYVARNLKFVLYCWVLR